MRLDQKGDAALILAICASIAITAGVLGVQALHRSNLKSQIQVLDSLESFGANEIAAWQMVYKKKNNPSQADGTFDLSFQNRIEVTPPPNGSSTSGGARRISNTSGFDSANTLVRRLAALRERLETRGGTTFYCGESTTGGGGTSATCLVEGTPVIGCGLLPDCGGIELCPGTVTESISSIQQFRDMQSSRRYRLTRDLDFGGGSVSIPELDNIYIDGNGHEIRNVTLNSTARTGELAIIGSVGSAVVKNLTLKNISVSTSAGSRLVVGGLIAKVTGNFCGDSLQLQNVLVRAGGDSGSTGANLASTGGLIGRVDPKIVAINNGRPEVPDSCPGCAYLNSVIYAAQKVVIQNSNANVDISDQRTVCPSPGSHSQFITATGGWIGSLSVGTEFKFLRGTMSGRVVGWANVGGVVGTFGPLGKGEVSELSLRDLTVEAPNGCVINRPGGSIIEPTQKVGGVVGNITTTGGISLSRMTSQNLTAAGGMEVGGLIGNGGTRAIVDNSTISVRINPTLPWKTAGTVAGGMFGWGRAEITNSSVDAQVYGSGTIGGLAGALDFQALQNVASGGALRSYWYPRIVGTKTSGRLVLEKADRPRGPMQFETDVHIAGGLAGFMAGGHRPVAYPTSPPPPPQVSNSFSSMDISSPQGPIDYPATFVQPGAILGGSGKMGGLVGMVSNVSDGLTIENCYATGRIEGTADMGGLVGVSGKNMLLKIVNSYFSGSIVANAPTSPRFHGVLGLVGNGFYSDTVAISDVNDMPYLQITNSFWDTARLQRPPSNPYTSLPPNGTPVSTSQLRDRSTYAGWDFAAVWHPPSGGPPLLR